MTNRMKALVLSGGKGTRLKPFTESTTKQLLPVANRPILFFILDLVRKAGIKTTGIVVSREWGEKVRQAVGSRSDWGMDVTYIVQDEPAGLAHAVRISGSFLKDCPFFMVLGDNVYGFDVTEFVSDFWQRKADALVLVKAVRNPGSCGIAEIAPDGRVEKVIEKPKEPKSNMALSGIYAFSPAIHDAIAKITPSARGELEITDAIQKLIDMNKAVYGHVLNGWWLDTGTRDDWLKANQAVLTHFLRPHIDGEVDAESRVTGKVAIEKGAAVRRSTLRGPCAIGDGCILEESQIGPFVSIGRGTRVVRSSIDRCVILEDCELNNLENLKNSIVGNRTRIIGR